MKWSIIIFCYNEEQTIREVIESTISFLNEPKNEKSEVIIVDDGSSDSTSIICKNLCTIDSRIKLIRHEHNKGIGAALKSGYLVVHNDYVCAIPGDGQFDINELKQVEAFKPSNFVSFYRTSKNYNLYRSSLTWINNKFNELFLGIQLTDVNWIKIYPAEMLKEINFELNSSLIESEIVAKLILLDCRPVEIPSKYLPRKGGISRGGSLKTLIKAIKDVRVLYNVVAKKRKALKN